MFMMRMLKIAALPLLVLVISIAVFQYLKATKPQSAPAQVTERAWMIDAMTISLQDWQPQHPLYGLVESNEIVSIKAPLSATVSEVQLKEGERFAANEVLLRLDPTEVELTVHEALAEYEEAKANLVAESQSHKVERARLQHEQDLEKISAAEYERNLKLLKRDLISESVVEASREAWLRQQLALMNTQLQVDQQQARLSQLNAQVLRARSRYQRAQLNAQRAQVSAPYAGRLAQVSVAPGDLVATNSALLQYYALDSLELRAVLPRIHRITVEHALESGDPIQARFSHRGHHYDLTLSRLGGQASQAGIEAFFSLPAELQHLRPGERLDVLLQLPRISHAVALPFSALYGQDRVYVVEDQRLQMRRVQPVGEVDLDGQRWALVQGDLHQGDQVSITHLPNAISGLKVNISQDEL